MNKPSANLSSPLSVLVSAFLVCFVGCAVGPDFQQPGPEMPEAYIGVVPQPKSAEPCQHPTESALHCWWEGFADTELTKLITDATETNLDLAAAKSRILQARAARGEVIAGLLPSLDLSADFRRSRTQSSRGATVVDTSTTVDTAVVDVPAGALTRDQYQGGFDAVWELDIFGGNRRAVEAAEADVEAAIEDAHDVKVVLAADIAANYFDLRRFDEQIALTEKNISALSDISSLIERKRAAGFVNGLDDSAARAQLLSSSADLPRLKDQRQAVLYNLSLLSGGTPGALLAELTEAKTLPMLPLLFAPGEPAELLERRPDIRRAAARVHAATARIGVAKSDLYPKLSLSGLLTWQGATFSSVAEGKSSIWSFGPSIQWPLFDGGRIAANIELQDELSREALMQYQLTVLTALSEVEKSLSTYRQEAERTALLAKAVAENERSVDISNRLYRAGLTDFINVLTSERSLFASQQALLDSRRTGLQSVTTLYKALGGGWDLSPN